MKLRLARPGEGEQWEVDGPDACEVVRVVTDDDDGATRLVAMFVGPLGSAIAEANATSFVRGARR